MNSSSSRRARFDLLELVLIAALTSVGTFAVVRTFGQSPGMCYADYQTQQEAERFRSRYGPARYSEHEEEWIVRDFFKDRRNGVFVDVGSNHYKVNSNTYYLEHELGWSGIAVDPQRGFTNDYAKYRPRTRFFPLFVGESSHQKAKMYVLDRNLLVSSADPTFVKDFGSGAREVDVPTITLTDLLDAAKLDAFDFLSIDVELSEPKVLAGFAIDRFKPKLVCIEAHTQVRQQILDYFALHRYVIVGEYLRVDTQNLYFRPLE